MKHSLLTLGLWGSLVWIMLAQGHAGSSKTRKAAEPGLYFYDNAESSPVLEYKGHDEKDGKGDFTISKNPSIVNFYGAFCPSCQVFKDKYIRLAKKVQATPGGESIEFYGVSCLAHQDICHGGKYKVTGFPALIALSGADGSDSGGETLKFKKSYEVSDIFKALEIPLPDTSKSDKREAKTTSSTVRKLEERNNEDKTEEETSDKEETPVEDGEQASEGDNEKDSDEGDGEGKDDEKGETTKEDGGKPADDDAKQVKAAKAASTKDNGIEDSEEKTDDETEEESQEGDESEAKPPSGKDVPPPPDKPIRLENDQVTEAESAEEGREKVSDPGAVAIKAVKRVKEVQEDVSTPVQSRKATKEAVLAAEKFKQDMARWKTLMKEKRKQIEGRQGRFGGPRVSALTTVSGEAVPSAEGMTTTMKSVTKGTKEYNERRKAMLKMIEKLKERRIARETGKTLNKDSIFVKGNFPFKVEARQQTFVESRMSNFPFVKKYFNFKPEEENVLDASVSFLHGLKYGVYEVRDQPLPPRKKRILKNWLDLLAISLPPEWGIHTTIEELRSNIDSIANHDSNLEKILDKSPLATFTWSRSCSKGKPSAGFSCGFWKLLHIMTIGVAEHRGGLNLIETGVISSSSRVFSPGQAADVWRNYMAAFYSCTECKIEFLNQYDSCMFGRCERLKEDPDTCKVADWKELAKYAWEFHNAVSIRVAENRVKNSHSEFSTKKKKEGADIKAIFPSIEQCLACFKEDGSWNEDAVFLFLEKTYWSGGSVLDPKISRFLRYDKTSYYRTSQFRVLWWMTIVALAIFVTMRRQINKAGLQKSMVVASSLMSRHVVARATGGKMRSN